MFDYSSLLIHFREHLKTMTGLKELSDRAQPTAVHRLMKEMLEHGILLRWYTQNIDALEFRPADSFVPGNGSQAPGNARCVALHGSLQLVICSKCFRTKPWTEEHTEVFRLGSTIQCDCIELGL